MNANRELPDLGAAMNAGRHTIARSPGLFPVPVITSTTSCWISARAAQMTGSRWRSPARCAPMSMRVCAGRHRGSADNVANARPRDEGHRSVASP
jgi:hypothetical protein